VLLYADVLFNDLFQAKLWNIRQCKHLRTLFGHTCSVFCVDLDDEAKTGFTGSADRVRNALPYV
jgi:WD40 repeat protein